MKWALLWALREMGPWSLSEKAHTLRQNTVHHGSDPQERAIRKTQVAKGEFAFVLPKGEGKLHIHRDAGRKAW